MTPPYRRNRLLTWASGGLSILLLAPLSASAGTGDIIAAVAVLREGGCGGIVPATPPLHHDAALDRAAAQWAGGTTPGDAARRNGYTANTLSGLHVTGADPMLVQLLSRSCRTIAERGLHDLGVYHRGLETWLLLATRYTSTAPATAAGTSKRAGGQTTALAPRSFTAPSRTIPSSVASFAAPVSAASALAAPAHAAPVSAASSFAAPTRAAPSSTASFAVRALQLVNDSRARGARCGDRSFAPAPPVRLSVTLNDVALGHAADMARHDYFEHEDLAGRSPADRVRAVGYAEKLVGENIAYGPESADEVVKGWLDSPGHCENIMDPRFAAMGIAYSFGQVSRRGLYWVQLLVAPKT